MSEILKSPLTPSNPARLPIRYRISVKPGTKEERLQRATLAPGAAHQFDVDPALAGECWIYLFRHPTEFNVPRMKDYLTSLQFEVGKLEHLLAFAERFPEEIGHLPLMALGTSAVEPFPGGWQLLVFPALKGVGQLGSVGVDDKDYNKSGDKWIEDDVTFFGVRSIK